MNASKESAEIIEALVPRPQPEMTAEGLLLRPFRLEGDPDHVQISLQAREIAVNTRTIEHPYPEGAALKWISGLQPLWETGSAAVFAICEENSPDVPVGAIGLHVDPNNASAELGYWIAVPHWGKGIASRAAARMIQFGFEELGLNRIHAHHIGPNLASGRVMLKVGMKFEGTFRMNTRKWGVFNDTVHYAILEREWAEQEYGTDGSIPVV
jgi:[ribosomal protein S5]-alanine N-acetyltransferase